MMTKLSSKELEKYKEPSTSDIFVYIRDHPGESYYTAREILREQVYGRNPLNGSRSWGDYWKQY